MIKTYLNLLIFTLLVFITTFLFGQKLNTEKKVLKVAFDVEYEPYEFLNLENKEDGFTPALLNEIGKSANVTFVFIPMTWSEEMEALESGKVDLINMIYSPERLEIYNFSHPHSQISQALFRTERASEITGLSSLEGHIVGFQENDISLQMLANRTDFKKIIYHSKLDGFLHLNNGEIDAFFCAQQTGIEIVSKYKFTNINLAKGELFSQNFAFATRKGNSELIELLDTHLVKLKDSGKLQTLKNKWLSGKLISQIWIEKNKSLLLLLFVIFVGLLILLFIFNVVLRRRVNDKTKFLKKSEEKFRNLVETTSDIIWETNIAGLFVYVSPQVESILGYKQNEFIGRSPFYFMPSDEAIKIKKISDEIVASKKTYEGLVNINLHKDGHKVFFETSGVPIIDEYNNLLGYRGINRNISERIKAETELRSSQQLIEGIINAIPVRVFWKDKNSVFLGCNDAFARDAGFESPKEIIGKDDFQMGWHDQAELYRADDRYVIENGQSKLLIEEQQTTPDGKLITLLTSKIPLRNSKGIINGVLGTYLDITEHKQAEVALQKSEEKLSSILNDMTEVVWSLSWPDFKILFISPSVEKLYGRQINEFIEQPFLWRDVIHPDDKKTNIEIFEKLIKDGFTENERRIIRPDGTIVWIYDRSHLVYDNNNVPIRIDGLVSDVTVRKNAELALKESENKYRNLVENALVGVYKVDLNSDILFCNDEMLKIIEYNGNDFTKLNIKSFYKNPDERNFLISTIEKNSEIKNFEAEWITSKGNIINVIINKKREGDYLTCMVLDITNHKIAEEKIKNAHDQLEQLYLYQNEVRENERTTISREIHDELGQLLSALKIDLSWSRDNEEKKTEVKKKIKGMIDIVNDTIKTVQRISSDLRPGLLDDLGLVPAIEWYCQTFKERTCINCYFKSDDFQFTDEKKNLALYRILQEGLTNVLRHSKAKNVIVNLNKLEDSIILEIIDDGIGMKQEKIDSYKSLGFVGIRERVKQFNGNLDIISERKKGTLIRVIIPFNKKNI